jgi:hypothetical protein
MAPLVTLAGTTLLMAVSGCSDSASGGRVATDAGVLDGGTSPDAGDSGTGADGAVDDGLLPVLSNFRVEDAHHDRV